jgi:uncharacterized integral membrane protein
MKDLFKLTVRDLIFYGGLLIVYMLILLVLNQITSEVDFFIDVISLSLGLFIGRVFKLWQLDKQNKE